MFHNQPFRVVIVGASVAGLSLANMLQANDIDFIVLEAHPFVAPQVGASIGLLPHGNLILDQLGLYDKISKVAPSVKTFNFRDSNGSVLAQHHDMNERLVERLVFIITLSPSG
jgi:2-polyprenyl-6-methoxyphenol hydroxylase-like FAD-dependent oxidoreductase